MPREEGRSLFSITWQVVSSHGDPTFSNSLLQGPCKGSLRGWAGHHWGKLSDSGPWQLTSLLWALNHFLLENASHKTGRVLL